MTSKKKQKKTPNFEYSFPTIDNVFLDFKNQTFFWSEKIDGSNVTFFSNGDVCSRMNKLCEDKLSLNGINLKPEQQKLIPIFQNMINELKLMIKCDFEINIVGELINTKTDLQIKYNKKRFNDNEIYYYGLVIFNCENQNLENILQHFNIVKNTTNDNKFYYRIHLNQFLVDFFNKHNLKTPECFGELSFEEFFNKTEMLNKLTNSEIEGYVLSVKNKCLKFKNIVENENSLRFIENKLEFYKNQTTKTKEDDLCIEILTKMKSYYDNPKFASNNLIENIVEKVIGKGFVSEKLTLNNIHKYIDIVYNETLIELQELEKESAKKNIMSIVNKILKLKLNE